MIKGSKYFVFLRGVYDFYRSGFCRMRTGRTLWKIIILKLFVMFAILKVFFFPNFLKENFATDKERAEHVAERFTIVNGQADKHFSKEKAEE